MRKTIVCFCLCLAWMYGQAQYGPQFENRGLEQWANFGNGNNTIEPVHWHSNMSADGTFAGFLSQQIEPSTMTRPGSTGTKSARVWAHSVLGVIANGNLTNGRMHAGSMSPSGSGNYNYTQRSDERFNTPIASVPDSLTLWVCFRAGNLYQNAQVRAIVHGDADMAAMANNVVEPENQLVALATRDFTRTSEPGVNYQWQRLSIPFTANGPCNDPRYILFCATTNKVPGEGSESDELFIDDILLVYKPMLRIEDLSQTQLVFGDLLNVSYTLEGTMSPENLGGLPNEVILQLSSPTGSFNTPTELGRMASNVSGTLHVTIPSTIASGDHYRMRVVTTNYPMISEDNGTDLSIGSNSSVAETEVEEGILGVEVFDLSGRMVINSRSYPLEGGIFTEALTPGVYLVKYHRSSSCEVKKILIR